jgi:hypothetical protein
MAEKLINAIGEYNRPDTPDELGGLKQFVMPLNDTDEEAKAIDRLESELHMELARSLIGQTSFWSTIRPRRLSALRSSSVFGTWISPSMKLRDRSATGPQSSSSTATSARTYSGSLLSKTAFASAVLDREFTPAVGTSKRQARLKSPKQRPSDAIPAASTASGLRPAYWTGSSHRWRPGFELGRCATHNEGLNPSKTAVSDLSWTVVIADGIAVYRG